jgi:hypothetical protein
MIGPFPQKPSKETEQHAWRRKYVAAELVLRQKEEPPQLLLTEKSELVCPILDAPRPQ